MLKIDVVLLLWKNTWYLYSACLRRDFDFIFNESFIMYDVCINISEILSWLDVKIEICHGFVIMEVLFIFMCDRYQARPFKLLLKIFWRG